jgi:pyruvate/2-oxoglutarate/acetoin dehydrogenase E1 component
MPYPKHLEDAALPQTDKIVKAVQEMLGSNG